MKMENGKELIDITNYKPMEDLVLINKALNMFLCVERGKALSETRSHIEVIGVFSKGEFGSLVYSVHVVFKYNHMNRSYPIYKLDAEIRDLSLKDDIVKDTNIKVLSGMITYIRRSIGFWDEIVYEKYHGYEGETY